MAKIKYALLDDQKVRAVLKDKGQTATALSEEMGMNRSWISEVCQAGKCEAAKLKFMALLLGVEEKELMPDPPKEEPKAQEPVQVGNPLFEREVLDRLSKIELSLTDLVLEVAKMQSIRPDVNPPTDDEIRAAEQLLARTLGNKGKCEYDAFFYNAAIKDISSSACKKAMKNLHCEIRKQGYGKNQTNWIVKEVPNG